MDDIRAWAQANYANTEAFYTQLWLRILRRINQCHSSPQAKAEGMQLYDDMESFDFGGWM